MLSDKSLTHTPNEWFKVETADSRLKLPWSGNKLVLSSCQQCACHTPNTTTQGQKAIHHQWGGGSLFVKGGGGTCYTYHVWTFYIIIWRGSMIIFFHLLWDLGIFFSFSFFLFRASRNVVNFLEIWAFYLSLGTFSFNFFQQTIFFQLIQFITNWP